MSDSMSCYFYQEILQAVNISYQEDVVNLYVQLKIRPVDTSTFSWT